MICNSVTLFAVNPLVCFWGVLYQVNGTRKSSEARGHPLSVLVVTQCLKLAVSHQLIVVSTMYIFIELPRLTLKQ